MNLHGIVSGVVAAVNPLVPGTIRVSTGSTTAADGTRTPTYAAPVTVPMQVQPLTKGEIEHLDGLNIQSTGRGIYVNGHVDGLVRATNKGGDLITLTDGPNAGVWLVVAVLEAWADWTKCAVTLQNGS